MAMPCRSNTRMLFRDTVTILTTFWWWLIIDGALKSWIWGNANFYIWRKHVTGVISPAACFLSVICFWILWFPGDWINPIPGTALFSVKLSFLFLWQPFIWNEFVHWIILPIFRLQEHRHESWKTPRGESHRNEKGFQFSLFFLLFFIGLILPYLRPVYTICSRMQFVK